jgi:hypothetical protein
MDTINLGKISIPVIKPEKGIDYYTPTERQEVVTEILSNVNSVIAPQEQARQNAEALRVQAETQRQTNETTRQSNETSRSEAETSRTNAESTRQTNESARATAESERATTFATQMQAVDNAINNIEDMTQAYNENATSKTDAFNRNASSKTGAFDSNASIKTNSFNSNYNSKMSAFDSNAQYRTQEFDAHTQEFQTRLANVETAKHTHSNKTILDNTTASYTTEEKAKLAGLENYDDAEVKGDISDIKTEQTTQNESIQALQNENTELKEDITNLLNNSPEVTGEGSNIVLQGTSKNKYKQPPLPGGNSTQVQYSGKNLFDADAFITEARAKGYNENQVSKTTYLGKEVLKYKNSLTNLRFMQGDFEENTRYVLKTAVAKTGYNGGQAPFMAIVYTDGTNTASYIEYSSSNFIEKTIVSTANKTIDYITVQEYSSSQIVYLDLTVTQLEKNSIATDYEPYVRTEYQALIQPINKIYTM